MKTTKTLKIYSTTGFNGSSRYVHVGVLKTDNNAEIAEPCTCVIGCA